jgi:hypothetical protein
MTENLDIASGVYRTQQGQIAVDPALALDPQGHPVRNAAAAPPNNLNAWFLNSACGLLACCYMDALGKVHLHGQGGNRQHVESFVNNFMPDLAAECGQRGGPYGVDTLWTTYRNGFVHQFAAGAAVWGRQGRAADYWFDHQGRPAVNIDRLVAGTIAAIQRFRVWCDQQIAGGAVAPDDLLRWLGGRCLTWP